MMKIQISFLVLILLLANISIAANLNPTYTNQTILNSAFSQVTCRTNFTISLLDYVITTVPSTSPSLSPIVSNLNKQTTQLGYYASNGNITAFQSYITSTYDPQLSNVTSAITKSLKPSNSTSNTLVSNNTTASNAIAVKLHAIRQQYNSSRAAYQKCAFSVANTLATDKLSAYQSEVNQYQQAVSNLNSKGISTSNLSIILQSANSSLISPFSSAVTSATNATELINSINSYCLNNGCANGANFHLDAKFGFGVLAAIKNKAILLNANQSTLSAAQAYLTQGYATLSQAGSAQYSPAQQAQIEASLSNAAFFLRRALTGKLS